MKHNVYLYGMTLLTTSHLLTGDFPALDGYAEIRESHVLPGGETGTCAVVLSALGCGVKLDGNHQGVNTYEPLTRFYRGIGVDTSRLRTDNTFTGLQDLVIISGHDRTVFGRFGAYFNDPVKRWSVPVREDIEQARVVGIDPFFGEESERAALYCRELGRPYVTIDCRSESVLHRYSSVNVVSGEFIRQTYPGADIPALFKTYSEATDGLVIFTFGASSLLYGRRGREPGTFAPYRVDAVSTLGAGDTFKAGAVWAVLMGMDDLSIVRTASACAALACSAYPIAENPPTREKIEALFERFGY